jgi:hypothetical protein
MNVKKNKKERIKKLVIRIICGILCLLMFGGTAFYAVSSLF